jgi:hypothetical protein
VVQKEFESWSLGKLLQMLPYKAERAGGTGSFSLVSLFGEIFIYNKI